MGKSRRYTSACYGSLRPITNQPIAQVPVPCPFLPAEVTVLIEASRPKAPIIADHTLKSKGATGANRKHGPFTPHKNMNWFYPPVWVQIVNACLWAGYPFETADIIRRLQAQNPAQFKTLQHQRFSEWIDHTHSDQNLHFKPEIQHRISSKQAIQPAGHTSQVSILVCKFYRLTHMPTI